MEYPKKYPFQFERDIVIKRRVELRLDYRNEIKALNGRRNGSVFLGRQLDDR